MFGNRWCRRLSKDVVTILFYVLRSVYDAIYLTYNDVRCGDVVQAKILEISVGAGLKVALGSWKGKNIFHLLKLCCRYCSCCCCSFNFNPNPKFINRQSINLGVYVVVSTVWGSTSQQVVAPTCSLVLPYQLPLAIRPSYEVGMLALI